MRAWLVVLVLVTALSGCFDPFRVHVSSSALDASPLDWTATEFEQEGETFGLKAMETRYVHRTDNDRQVPFPGVLQVFSLRGSGATDAGELGERASDILDEALQREGINIDADKTASGERRIASGVQTQWELREGTIASGRGDFFDPEETITVRVLSEVGVDGRSSTGIIAIAFVKIAQESSGVVPGIGDREVRDEQTWFDVIADPDGSIQGATLPEGRGLLYHLVTHD